MSIAVDPAKHDVERMSNERDTLDFRPGVKRSSQLTSRIDGIDRDFLFWNVRAGAALPLVFGGHTGVWRLSLRDTNYYNVYLGTGTNSGLSGVPPHFSCVSDRRMIPTGLPIVRNLFFTDDFKTLFSAQLPHFRSSKSLFS